ncbi:hypothetical protein OCGS_2760 [Oceaniovalibus guishaninsula JLT2003]|uniref:Uncharacterized protein n=1 Tax=Oceaniovalibus guishaninsula JLT2003 TaxID=1231392 RepID=K2HJL6_9RHOB|nr:hypothetical protein OCGS_2760 [Oceaniovalibus guishaninsula JLT2003]
MARSIRPPGRAHPCSLRESRVAFVGVRLRVAPDLPACPDTPRSGLAVSLAR